MSVPSVSLTLIGKPDCHLCDDARAAIAVVLWEFEGLELAERSILDDPELHEKYWDEIPVVLVNDRVHTIWRVDPDRLRTALTEAGATK
jgi:hypothetical protein